MKQLNNTNFKILWRIMPTHLRSQAFLVLLLTLVGAGFEMLSLGMVAPVLSILLAPNYLTDLGLPDGFHSWLGRFSHEELVAFGMASLLAAYLIKGIYLAGLGWIQARFAYTIKALVSDALLTKYMYLDHEFHLKENSARLIRNITIEVEQFVSNALIPAIRFASETLIIIAILWLLIYLNPITSLWMGLIVFLAMLSFHKQTQNLLTEWGTRRQDAEGYRIQMAQEALGGLKETRLLNRENWFINEYSKANWLSSKMARNQLALSQLPYIFLEIVAISALTFLVLFLIGSGADIVQIIPVIGLFGAAAFRTIPSANRMLMALQSVRYASSVIRLIDTEMTRPNPEISTDNSPLRFEDKISLSDVSYKYFGRTEAVLADINLTIKRGEKIGLIGKSGAGKSTFIDVFLGLLKPSHGIVKVDGKNVGLNINSWQLLIGYVPQQIFLTDDTLRRNIALGLPDDEIDEAKLQRALKQAQLSDFISTLENGLDTKVGERGVRISGGQLQRVGIARALYQKPSILILDEASSALDMETERSFMESINKLQGLITIIIVTHRPSTLTNCDRIYRIDNGTIIDANSVT